MKRSGPLKADPEKTRAWQRRSQPIARSALKPGAPKKRTKKRRNDAPWKVEVHRRYGTLCVSCGAKRDVQADHMMPRSQGGASDPRNGLPLCGPFSDTGMDCHGRKTASTMLIRPEWLDQEQIDFLAEVDWVHWDEDGQPRGRGWRHFAPMAGAEIQKGG